MGRLRFAEALIENAQRHDLERCLTEGCSHLEAIAERLIRSSKSVKLRHNILCGLRQIFR